MHLAGRCNISLSQQDKNFRRNLKELKSTPALDFNNVGTPQKINFPNTEKSTASWYLLLRGGGKPEAQPTGTGEDQLNSKKQTKDVKTGGWPL